MTLGLPRGAFRIITLIAMLLGMIVGLLFSALTAPSVAAASVWAVPVSADIVTVATETVSPSLRIASLGQ